MSCELCPCCEPTNNVHKSVLNESESQPCTSCNKTCRDQVAVWHFVNGRALAETPCLIDSPQMKHPKDPTPSMQHDCRIHKILIYDNTILKTAFDKKQTECNQLKEELESITGYCKRLQQNVMWLKRELNSALEDSRELQRLVFHQDNAIPTSYDDSLQLNEVEGVSAYAVMLH